MNALNLFKFLEKEKGRPVPFLVKHKLNILKPEDLIIEGDLNFEDATLENLPDNMVVKGDLNMQGTTIDYLPKNLEVQGDFYLNYSDVKSNKLPSGLIVKYNLTILYTDFNTLPPDLKIDRDLVITESRDLGKISDKELRAMLKTGYIKGRIDRV
jgi:endonuclease/exonuclease/phosphatase family metal-dependent hydrolase